MSLEPCPTCGYALSTLDHHCRHCLPSRSAWAKAGSPLSALPSFRPFDAKHRSKMIMAVVALSIILYLILFH